MIKTFLPWLIRAIPMGGHRTYVISILLVLVGIGMFAAAFMGLLPSDIAIGVAATTILLGLQGFFGRAATSELENQLGLAIALIADTRDKVAATPGMTEVPLPDVLPGDNTANVRGDAAHTLTDDDRANGIGWQ